MPITSGPLQSMAPAANAGSQNPLTPTALGTPNVNPASLQMNPEGVVNTLAGNAPQSLTSLLLPLYQQLFGNQTGALAQNQALQSQQGVAQAQSNAQARGLTGSSIEAGAMQGAQASAQRDYTQGYASLLGNFVNQYSGLAGQDVSNQQQYYGNLAQALGQGYASKVQQDQFHQQLEAGISAANQNARATEMAGIFSGLGNAVGSGVGAFAAFSDIRLKKNVEKIGMKHGFNVYSYEYDREKYPELKARMPIGKFIGFMAHHVAEKYPEAVQVIKGYLAIDYGILAKAVV